MKRCMQHKISKMKVKLTVEQSSHHDLIDNKRVVFGNEQSKLEILCRSEKENWKYLKRK